ncbi:MAG: PIG-L family deacetylase [Candidatus Tectomicrobia bacterium]|nr:PIG-L family deacetylase [Candidatus Tectomicrobia bacterium]
MRPAWNGSGVFILWGAHSVDDDFCYNRVLVIAAHPDDIDYGVAGSVAVWTRGRKVVGYCVATSGEKGFDRDLPIEERMRIREEEQQAAAGVVGVEDVFFLRRPDGELENTRSLQREIVSVIRRFRPDVVVARDPASARFDSFYGCHPDHRAIAEAVFDAIYPAAGNRFFFPDLLKSGLEPHKVKEVLFGSSSSPDYYVDISPTLELKIKALRCHRSQIGDEENVEEVLRDWARKVGEPAGIPLAEAFRRMKNPEA